MEDFFSFSPSVSFPIAGLFCDSLEMDFTRSKCLREAKRAAQIVET
jgi:hypothetical protein